MKMRIRAFVLALLAVCVYASAALGAPKTFTILPFAVNGSDSYKYLEKQLPEMLSSRLTWKGQLEPARGSSGGKKIDLNDDAGAAKARAAARADYVIWGALSMLGDRYSMDMRIQDAQGNTRPFSREGATNGFFGDLRQIADGVSGQVIPNGRSAVAQPQPQQPAQRPMNREIVQNQNTPNAYLNPNLRYAGGSSDTTRLRSQTLPFTAVGMEVTDADGDGQNEVFLLGDNKIYAYRFKDQGTLTDKPLAVMNLPRQQQALSIRSIDLSYTGKKMLIVNSKVMNSADDGEELYTRVVSFDGKKFKEVAKELNVFLGVVNLPPLFRPQLVAQRGNPPHLFVPGVHEAAIERGKIVFGSRVDLPKDCNVFNFSYIPAGRDRRDEQKIIVLDGEEHLKLLSDRGQVLAATEDRYSGALHGIYTSPVMPGMGAVDNLRGETVYVPMRMLPVDLDRDGKYEIIVNKPVSTAGAIFSGYRSFPQSEIHSLQWDGIGLSLVWKTKRIKGSVVDYTITDATGNGMPDLVVCVNTHPGTLGANARKSMVISYPLDLSKADPNAPVTLTE